MTIDIKKDNEKAVILVSGRLDTITTPSLEKAICEELEGIKELTLDLSQLSYISSAGLRVLLSTQKKMQKIGCMKLTGVTEEVMDIFEMTGFVQILSIE